MARLLSKVAIALAVVAAGRGALGLRKPQGVSIPLMRVEGSQQSRAFRGALSSGSRSIPILNDGDVALLGWFSFGSPGQNALLQLDTGSTVAWVVNKSDVARDSPQGPPHHGFSGALSSSYAPEGYSVELSYGSGSLSVSVGRDTLGWGAAELHAPLVQFGTTVVGKGWIENGWDGFDSDGILGLAMEGLCEWRSCTSLAWQQLLASGGLPPAFSLLTTFKMNAVAVGGATRSLPRGPRLSMPEREALSVRDATSRPLTPREAELSRTGAGGGSLSPESWARAAARPSALAASSEKQSMITLGGLNVSHAASGAKLYSIPLSYTESAGSYGYYWAELGGIWINAPGTDDDPGSVSWCTPGSPNTVGCEALFDSGTSLLLMPDEPLEYVKTFAQSAANNMCTDDNDFFSCPRQVMDFDSLPNVTMRFQVASVTELSGSGVILPPAAGSSRASYDFTLPGPLLFECDDVACVLRVDSVPSSVGGISYILGDTFLRAYTTLFDARGRTVGVARSVAMPEPVQGGGADDVVAIVTAVVAGIFAFGLAAIIGIYLYRRRQDRLRAEAEETIFGAAIGDPGPTRVADDGVVGEVATGSRVLIEGRYVELKD